MSNAAWGFQAQRRLQRGLHFSGRLHLTTTPCACSACHMADICMPVCLVCAYVWCFCTACQFVSFSVAGAVQVRQHVDHKRTFMFLEQLILKHNAHEQCINIKEIHQGIDFFFANRAHGQKFIDFLQVRYEP